MTPGPADDVVGNEPAGSSRTSEGDTPAVEQRRASLCPWCGCVDFHTEFCKGFEVNDPMRAAAVVDPRCLQPARYIVCADTKGDGWFQRKTACADPAHLHRAIEAAFCAADYVDVSYADAADQLVCEADQRRVAAQGNAAGAH